MIILLHTSKTMRQAAEASGGELTTPMLIHEAQELMSALTKLPSVDIEHMMKISPKLAEDTKVLIKNWSEDPAVQRAAVDSFLGDIYSGLQVQEWSIQDRAYAQKHLRILSGLYGILRPLDGIYPYRFEMGYKIPNQPLKNMYEFWGKKIADTLPTNEPIINLTAVEYGRTVTTYIDNDRIITPKFLTVSPKTGEPMFVTVHAKIARGAFANWLIKHRTPNIEQLIDFKDLGYIYSAELSTELSPVFVCDTFAGLGLSVRRR